MDNSIDKKQSCCNTSNHSEPESKSRRQFVKGSGLTALMLMAGSRNVMAGPFNMKDYNEIIPADKKLSKQWIASLYERGKAMTATGDNLKYIGMPINGICTGQVYLGGDGTLWRWNITGKRNVKKENPKGERYLDPEVAESPLNQGFAIKVDGDVRTLDSKGFANIVFTNQYPMANVDFKDSNCTVDVALQAYTPFIPLNRDDSSQPVIVMKYTLTNRSTVVKDTTIAGWIPDVIEVEKEDKRSVSKAFVYSELDSIATVESYALVDSTRNDEFGAMAIGLLNQKSPSLINLSAEAARPDSVFWPTGKKTKNGDVVSHQLSDKQCGALGHNVRLEPGESKTVSFVLSWHIPMTNYDIAFGRKKSNKVFAPNHYATLSTSASDAANKLAKREQQLHANTQKWTDTWYDSTLPYWFLERTFLTVNCVQTEMGQRVAQTDTTPEHYNFYEGVRCCPGNCTHVFHYAQGLARIFPSIERECRDKIEYGLGFDEQTGVMHHRYSNTKFGDAIDGNCGTIIRVYREHQMTTDYRFLKSIWPRTKLSMEHVIEKWDANEDGMLEGPQHNTLDEPWYGQVHWLINLYHASLKVCAVMARKMNEPRLAERYESIVAKGVPAMVELLWREDFGYFIHKPGPGEKEKHGSTNGCHIDQILGDSWLLNVGIDNILPKNKIKQSLESLWKYNFTPDVGAFRAKITEGRWYAGEGDAGLVMSSFPFGKIEPKSGKKSYAGYLNECMTGFEWQVAAHMIWEGMVEKGLAIGKAINDRYQPELRNPYNEIECSDHYSRAMASYGAYTAMCGYQYDGPDGLLAFAPKLQPEDFRAAFTAAEGWGSFIQLKNGRRQIVSLDLRYGQLALNTLKLAKLDGVQANQVEVTIDGRSVDAKLNNNEGSLVVTFEQGLTLKEHQMLTVELS
ncbi:GH116 family glycosyl hydrolase [Psychrosphaera sp. 1_MG-2023]|uniref:GH116 family glycosyl hydrolase n=1 Tax=Psychrosphaera sp. 1_MG-2023 TaxID=3062643 RepID=UPI0026E20351|nr:GH116 family glycosyl hydrolase [Psychrosphaera sp. 1_MG-2023]MDO6721355.1 GH116 family glycosyl hydrolase [Psychrosphaera sp. 1_MG-2023]